MICISQMGKLRLGQNKELVRGDPSLSACTGLEHDSELRGPHEDQAIARGIIVTVFYHEQSAR